MKRVLYIILFFLPVALFAEEDEKDVFAHANKLYQQEKYQEAINDYEHLLKKGYHSVELYFNLGNAYYKLDKVAPAIYYYEKSLLLNPNNKDVKNNLQFAKNRTIDEIKEVPKVGFEKLLQNFTGMLSYNSWAIVTVTLSFLFLFLFMGYYFSGTSLSKRIFFIGMFIVPMLILISVLSAWFEKHQYNSERPAIVFAEVVSVKNEPRDKATEAFILHEGTKVYVLETLQNWKKIRLSDETEGWIEAESIRELK